MARPRKQGLDYFPFDVDFFQDEKVICIAGEFGLKGELTIIKLLCAIYRNGYYALWNDMIKYKLVKELPGVSADLLDNIVNRLVRWGFFDKTLFDSTSVLTSAGIQRRYFEASRKRQPLSDLPYILSFRHNNAEETRVSAPETRVSASEMPQTKLKKSKLNNNTPSISPSAPSDHQSPTRPGAEWGEDFLKIFFDRTPEGILNKQLALLGISHDRYRHIAMIVLQEWNDTAVKHSEYEAAARHLMNHIRKKLRVEPSLRSAPTAAQRSQDAARRQARRQESEAAERSYNASVEATGLNGWQQYCLMKGLDPDKTSAEEISKL